MNEQKIRTLHVKRVKNIESDIPKEDKIRKVTIKKIKEEPTDIIHLRITSFRDFYDKYMKDTNESPRDYVTMMTTKINLIYYYMKTEVYEEDEKIKIILAKLNEVDYETYLDIFMNTSDAKLNMLNVLDTMIVGTRRIYELLHYLTIERGYIIDTKYPLIEIRSKLYDSAWLRDRNLRGESFGKRRTLKRMIAIKDDSIVDTNEYIEPIKTLKGGSIMVEYANNQYLRLPYMYYRRLAQIQSLVFQYTLNDITDFMQSDEYEKVELTTQRILCSDIPSIIRTCLEYYTRWEAINNMINDSTGFALIFEATNEKVEILYKDGTTDNYDVEHFLSYYMDFILG